jgi:hypothetical protein
VCCGCPLQASNIATTVRTIIVGLVYLATFIFSANALGLTGAHTLDTQVLHMVRCLSQEVQRISSCAWLLTLLLEVQDWFAAC